MLISKRQFVVAKLVTAALCWLTAGPVFSQSPSVPLAHNFQTDANIVKTAKIPLLVIVSATDCRYCALLKREIIQPMLVSGDYEDKVIIRELLLDQTDPIIDFDGASLSTADFARRYQQWLTPTLLFLNADGAELEAPIRGINSVDYYGYYLDQAIDRVLAKLRSF